MILASFRHNCAYGCLCTGMRLFMQLWQQYQNTVVHPFLALDSLALCCSVRVSIVCVILLFLRGWMPVPYDESNGGSVGTNETWTTAIYEVQRIQESRNSCKPFFGISPKYSTTFSFLLFFRTFFYLTRHRFFVNSWEKKPKSTTEQERSFFRKEHTLAVRWNCNAIPTELNAVMPQWK